MTVTATAPHPTTSSAAVQTPSQSSEASTSATSSQQGIDNTNGSSFNQPRKANSLWDQYMTSTGWFAPLVPPDSPAKLAEKQRRNEQKLAQEKSRRIHSWRPSEDEVSNGNAAPKRPTLRQRLSSAVELKWWPVNAPAPIDAANTAEAVDTVEEDLQYPRSSTTRIKTGWARDDSSSANERELGDAVQMRSR